MDKEYLLCGVSTDLQLIKKNNPLLSTFSYHYAELSPRAHKLSDHIFDIDMVDNRD